jgi:hypothetical protein
VRKGRLKGLVRDHAETDKSYALSIFRLSVSGQNKCHSPSRSLHELLLAECLTALPGAPNLFPVRPPASHAQISAVCKRAPIILINLFDATLSPALKDNMPSSVTPIHADRSHARHIRGIPATLVGIQPVVTRRHFPSGRAAVAMGGIASGVDSHAVRRGGGGESSQDGEDSGAHFESLPSR